MMGLLTLGKLAGSTSIKHFATIRHGTLAAAALVCLASATAARDNGRYANTDPALKAWVKELTDKKGNGCCDTADGYPAEVEWDIDTGRYRVRIEGEWYDVPDDALIERPNRLGYAMVWYYPTFEADGRFKPKIRCFLPGAGG
jgi:hypothetical protein